MPVVRLLLGVLALLSGCGGVAAAATVRVQNTARLVYVSSGAERSVASNTVTLDAVRSKRPTKLSFRLPPAGYVMRDLGCDSSDGIRLVPAPIMAATLAAAPPLVAFDGTSPFIVVLRADGQNLDPAVRDVAEVDLDTDTQHATLALTETGPNTGVFAGALPAPGTDASFAACDLQLQRGTHLRVSFTANDLSLGSSFSTLIDPAGYVFNSRDGALVDGAVVEMVDENGDPATVFGDDGVSAYPSRVVSGEPVTDASGRVYLALKGRYRFPLASPGRYFLKVTAPGTYRAPSTATREALAALADPLGRPFVINDASVGGALVLEDSVFIADVPLDGDATGTTSSGRAEPTLLLSKIASVRTAAPGDFIQYRLQVSNRGTAAEHAVHLVDTLPAGLRYERRSVRGGGEPTVSGSGRELDFPLPDVAAGATLELRYVVSVTPGAPAGEALNRARIFSAGNASNEAAAAVRLRPLLFSDAMTVIGRVSQGDCGDPASHRKGIAGVRLLLEDGTYVATDRDGLYHFEGVRAGRHVVQLDTESIPASYEPVACDVDTRQARSAISRFVEGGGGLLKRVDFQLRPTGRAAAADAALPVPMLDDAAAAGNRDWLTNQQPGVDWLFPAADHNPRAPVLRVAIKHDPGQRVALTVNGEQTDALAFDGTDTGAAVAVSKWTGLPLRAGDNRLVARVLDRDGSIVTTLERTVHYAGAPVHAVIDRTRSRLVADGLTRPLIAVRVTDTAGRPVRAGTLVPFRVDPPYTAALEAALQQHRQLAGLDRAEATTRVVGDDGYAFLALQPTTAAGAVHATVSLADDRQVRDVEVRTWLDAGQRDWVVVGFGAGSIGYRTLKTHVGTLPTDGRDRVATDGQLALYAKGRIKGSWLLTMAYDGDRRYDPDRGVLGTIDPDRYYTVYGDGTQQGYDAATAGRLYLRLERRDAYALLGDFETGMTDARLTRYSRTLTGVKAAYEGRRWRAQAFAAKTDTLYGRDEIQGNGLSGPYRLSGRDIVPNSDKLRIEVRNRFRPELIVSTTELTRHIDYDIDTAAGTVRFREPVLSRDPALNPIFVVADYEVDGGRGGKLAAGGRVAARLGAVDVGVAAIRDETVGAATVIGVDARLKLDGATELRAEAATGGKGGLDAGGAYLVEAEHHGGGIDVLAYARQQDAGFGVGQQNAVEAGTRKLGFDGRVAIAGPLSLAGTAWYQDMLAGPGRRIAADLRLEYRRAASTFYVGGQLADDRGIDGRARSSRLLTLGGSKTLFGGALTLAGQTQLAPGGDKTSVDFPVRHQLSAAWRVAPGIRLLGGYEIADGAEFTTHTAQVGFDVAPWTGAKLLSTLNQQAIGENGGRTFAQYGLSQSLSLGKRWSVDATLDAASTVAGRLPAGAAVTPFQPIASGGFIGQGERDGDYLAATLGATYRAARWSWNGRIEYRDGETQSRWGLVTNALRALGEGRTIAASIKAFRVTDARRGHAIQASADVALAWRPLDSRWSVLERLTLRHEGAGAGFDGSNVLGVPALGGAAQVTTRLVNNLAINFRSGTEGLGHGIEATGYYGAKYVSGRFADDRFQGYVDVTGIDVRRDLGRRLDIGLQASVQHAWSAGAWAWSAGPSAGISPAANLWVSAGYNLAGYRDRDFDDDRYTRAGPYLTVRLKFDQLSLGQAVRSLVGGGR